MGTELDTMVACNEVDINFRNSELKKNTDIIFKAMENTRNNLLVIAATLHKIDSAKLYANDFKDIYEYAGEVFNYKRAMVNNLVRIGAQFIQVEGDKIRTILAHDDADYTVSQLQEVLKIGASKAKKLDAEEVISPEMTTKEIREAVKSVTAKEKGDGNGDGDGEPKLTTRKVNAIIEKAMSSVEALLDLPSLTDLDKKHFERELLNIRKFGDKVLAGMSK